MSESASRRTVSTTAFPFPLVSLQGMWFLNSVAAIVFALLHALTLFRSTLFYRAAVVSSALSYGVSVAASVPAWRASAKDRTTFFALMFGSDNMQYIMFSLICLSSTPPLSVALIPLLIYAARQVAPIMRISSATAGIRYLQSACAWVCSEEPRLAQHASLGELITIANAVVFAAMFRSFSHITNAVVAVMWYRGRWAVSPLTRATTAAANTKLSSIFSHVPILNRIYRFIVDLLGRGLPAPAN